MSGPEAGNDKTLVGLSIARQFRLSERIDESSVSTILTSPPAVESAAPAARTEFRTVFSARGWPSQSGDSMRQSMCSGDVGRPGGVFILFPRERGLRDRRPRRCGPRARGEVEVHAQK